MKNWKKVVIPGILLVAVQANASPFSNWGGSNLGGNGCNDWPEWTPMYWMEKMFDSNDNCYQSSPSYPYSAYSPLYQGQGYQGQGHQGQGQRYQPYAGYSAPQTTYANPYGAYPGYANRGNPVNRPAYNYPSARMPYAGQQGYAGNRYNPYANYGRGGASPYSSSYLNNGFLNKGFGRQFPGRAGVGRSFSPFTGRSGGFPSMSNFGSGFNPLSNPLGGGSGFGMPMTGMSPMGFGSPFSPMGSMNPINPMNSFNPMSSMGGGGFSSPFSSGMSPFSSGMKTPFSF